MNKITLIIQREYNQRVRKKSFIITTLIMPILMAALMVVPALIMRYGGGEDKHEIVVIDHSGSVASKLKNGDITSFKPSSQSYEDAQKSTPDAYGYLVIGEDIITDPSALKLYTHKSSTIGLEKEITGQLSAIIENERIAQTNIVGLDSIMQSVKARASLSTFTISQEHEKSSSSLLSMAIGYIGGFMIYMFIFIYGGFVMHGVIEEKSSRIVEVIVSSVKPFELMMGKILGIALVALTQLLIWIVLFMTFTLIMQGITSSDTVNTIADSPNIGMIMNAIPDLSYMLMIFGCYILYFVGGYLLYAAMFAAVGSAVDNIQDASQLQLPISMPLILGMLIMMSTMQTPNSDISFWFSMIPFTSPIVMMARIPYGVPIWEIAASITLLYGTFVAMTWVSAKIYRVGIFMYGKKPNLAEIIKWARYKN